MSFGEVVELIGKVLDGVGVAVIVLGMVWACVRAVGRTGQPGAYRALRQDVGRAILLGLEILVAADIIRTVAVEPSLTSVAILAVIVAIRTILSFSLEVELEGHWPWRAAAARAASNRAGDAPAATPPG